MSQTGLPSRALPPCKVDASLVDDGCGKIPFLVPMPNLMRSGRFLVCVPSRDFSARKRDEIPSQTPQRRSKRCETESGDAMVVSCRPSRSPVPNNKSLSPPNKSNAKPPMAAVFRRCQPPNLPTSQQDVVAQNPLPLFPMPSAKDEREKAESSQHKIRVEMCRQKEKKSKVKTKSQCSLAKFSET